MKEIGTIIDNKYELVECISRGGMSVVYLAVNTRLGNRWAVKEIEKSDDDASRVYIGSVIAEANMMKNLNHPAFPRIVDIIEDDTALYLVMDYIEGETLAQIVERDGPVPEDIVRSWGLQLCEAFSYLHSQDPPVIYRDMKPSNVICEPDGMLTIIDFGVAREYDPGKTMDTVALGTKGFAPPEQYTGQTDARSDIYALGMTLRCLLTGVIPRSNDNVNYEEIYDELGVSDEMRDIIYRCTALYPEERYQSCGELARDLEAPVMPRKQSRRDARNTEKKSSKKAIILIIVICIALIGAGIAAFLLLNGGLKTADTAATETSTEMTTVPSVKGMTYDEAKTLLEKAGLKCQYTEEYSDTVEAGRVIDQSLLPNAQFKKGDVITLTVSLGPEAYEDEDEEDEDTSSSDDDTSSQSYDSDDSSYYENNDDSSYSDNGGGSSSGGSASGAESSAESGGDTSSGGGENPGGGDASGGGDNPGGGEAPGE